MKRPGRSVAAARRVIGMEEVLEAISASGRSVGQSAREDLQLDLLVLGRRLDHQVAVGEGGVVGGGA